jgi:hypothetical protein
MFTLRSFGTAPPYRCSRTAPPLAVTVGNLARGDGGIESEKIRKSTSTSSTALGLIRKGAGAVCGGAVEGGTFTACGFTKGVFWISVNYQGIKGYVALYCIKRP